MDTYVILSCLADVLARLSAYHIVPSSVLHILPVPHFIQPQSVLPYTAVVVVLDWTRPWTLLEELHAWFTWIEWWVQGDGALELEVIHEDNRQLCMLIVPSFLFTQS